RGPPPAAAARRRRRPTSRPARPLITSPTAVGCVALWATAMDGLEGLIGGRVTRCVTPPAWESGLATDGYGSLVRPHQPHPPHQPLISSITTRLAPQELAHLHEVGHQRRPQFVAALEAHEHRVVIVEDVVEP